MWQMLLILARVNIKEEESHLLLWHKSAISLSGCMAYTKQSGHHVDVIMQVVTQSLSAMQWDAPFSLLASSLVFSGGSRFFLWTFIRQCLVGDQSPKNRIPGIQECKCKGISWFISWGGSPAPYHCRKGRVNFVGEIPQSKKERRGRHFHFLINQSPRMPKFDLGTPLWQSDKFGQLKTKQILCFPDYIFGIPKKGMVTNCWSFGGCQVSSHGWMVNLDHLLFFTCLWYLKQRCLFCQL